MVHADSTGAFFTVIQLLKWNNNHYFTFNYSNFASKTFEFGVATNLDDDWPNFSLMGFECKAKVVKGNYQS